MDRDQQILELCKVVLNMSSTFWDNPNGAYESSCPICNALEKRGCNERGFPDFVSMDEIKHDPNCGYLIAKDLSTGLL